MATPVSASRRKPMICSSEKRFFTSNLLGIGNWTPNRCATQTRGDVGSPCFWAGERAGVLCRRRAGRSADHGADACLADDGCERFGREYAADQYTSRR
ncbi:hypothetical protein XavaCFBP5823_19160 [Xanthomonas axonopodis pv. vasculorum]|nr:hypothetical protein XavaCFBP5823_19160 [Xanthomonas axonopodis pv. vasculorum]